MYEKPKNPVCRRLKKLTLKDIVKPGKAPDLDAKAAEIRDFCTLVLEALAKSKKLHQGSLHEKAVYNVAKHCASMYNALAAEFDGSQMAASGEKFINQYMALEKKLSCMMKKTLLHGELSQSCISWVTYWTKPERATIPRTPGIIGMKLLLFSFSNCFTKEVAIPSLGTRLRKSC